LDACGVVAAVLFSVQGEGLLVVAAGMEVVARPVLDEAEAVQGLCFAVDVVVVLVQGECGWQWVRAIRMGLVDWTVVFGQGKSLVQVLDHVVVASESG
jgi:D-serine deaminase-like pyridoxal phosphate-dependent protein